MDEIELRACPNPECDSRAIPRYVCAGIDGEIRYVTCPDCGCGGPRGETCEDAARLWNPMPRREDSAELLIQCKAVVSAWKTGAMALWRDEDINNLEAAIAHYEAQKNKEDLA